MSKKLGGDVAAERAIMAVKWFVNSPQTTVVQPFQIFIWLNNEFIVEWSVVISNGL